MQKKKKNQICDVVDQALTFVSLGSFTTGTLFSDGTAGPWFFGVTLNGNSFWGPRGMTNGVALRGLRSTG